MKNNNTLIEFKKNKILILGLGSEGLSTYKFLRRNFPKKIIGLADQNPEKKLSKEFQEIIKKDQKLELELGQKYLDKLSDYQIIIKTAGIPITERRIQIAIKNGSKISSNTQIFFDLCPGKIIGVTGTKGKSTTSTLIHQILKDAGFDSILLGNIGDPPLNQLEKINQKTLIVNELSSHQLAELNKSPEIAIVQDIKSEHLDYYKNFEAYFQAKTAIAKYQKKDDIFIYNPELKGSSRMAKLSQAKKITHTIKRKTGKVFQKRKKIFYVKNRFLLAEKIINKAEIPLIGDHNLYNVMPAIIVAKIFDVPSKLIRQSIRNFKTLKHRLELIAEIKNVKYYDDSIATNPHAGIMAIRSFPKNSLVLIAGGYERNQNFSEYAKEIIKNKVKILILFPNTGERILEFIKTEDSNFKIQSFFVKTMSEAVKTASAKSKKGDIVLLSPASASFGLFNNYKDRGQQFVKAVRNLK